MIYVILAEGEGDEIGEVERDQTEMVETALSETYNIESDERRDAAAALMEGKHYPTLMDYYNDIYVILNKMLDWHGYDIKQSTHEYKESGGVDTYICTDRADESYHFFQLFQRKNKNGEYVLHKVVMDEKLVLTKPFWIGGDENIDIYHLVDELTHTTLVFSFEDVGINYRGFTLSKV